MLLEKGIDLRLSEACGIKGHHFSPTLRLCDNEMRGRQEIIHSTESVIQGVIVKCPLQKHPLPDDLK